MAPTPGRLPALVPTGLPPITPPPGISVGPSLPAPVPTTGAGTTPPTSGGGGGCGFFDVTCHITSAIGGWLAGLVTSALNPILDLLGRTVLATPDVTGGKIAAVWGLVAGIANALVVLLVSLLGLRHSIGEEPHSNDTVNAALVLEGRVSTYESALHAYLLTTNRGFLASLEQARHQLPPAHAQLAALVAGDGEERRRVAATWAAVESYVEDYATPLVNIAQISPDAARSSVGRLSIITASSSRAGAA